MMVDRVVPLTPVLWPALEKLFGKQGACMGCWCMYWQLPRKQWEATRGAGAKRLFKLRVSEGPPGVVALIGDDAVGWLQIGPRAEAPQWNGARRVSAPLKEADAEDPRVWAVTCFYVKSSARGQGVSEALLKGAIAFAKKNGARAIEGCPIDGTASAGAAYVGRTALFLRAKFREVARRKPNRPLMRLIIKR
ncbi:MAG: GNAT family N-acetyltransferase [Proteobacteria bacterium]|nr:GNAT family N-acetyltransferase [Pseudomonadota bacterium]